MDALELMVLACCSWQLFLAAVLGWLFLYISGPFSLPWTFGFLQLKPNSVSQDNSSCVASAHTMHFRGYSKSVVLHVCFIQQLVQDGIIIAKQCPTAVQIADIGTALPRVPFKSFSDQLLGDKHVGGY